MIQLRDLKDKGTFIEYGPASIVISIKKNNCNLKDAEKESVKILSKILNDLNPFKEMLKLKAYKLNLKDKKIPEVVKKAVLAAKIIDANELTPLSAIAGAVSETLMDEILKRFECDRVIVNNGGDIATYFSDSLEISINKFLQGEINNSTIRGIATSGLGGRSLSKGVADCVTVFAKNASIADAAATYIGNFVKIDSERIEFCRAELVDFNSDLKGEYVVKKEHLNEYEIEKALKNGMEVAENLIKHKKIYGAILIKNKNVLISKKLGEFFKQKMEV